MKKFILFFVLILGFISEGKAQFAASSEIHYYLCIANTGGTTGSAEAVLFRNNSIITRWISDTRFTMEKLNQEEKEIYQSNFSIPYDSEKSTNKYTAYWHGKAKLGEMTGWTFISKDKSEMIDVTTSGAKIIQKKYYKKVTKQDLINKNKPNFDFLE